MLSLGSRAAYAAPRLARSMATGKDVRFGAEVSARRPSRRHRWIRLPARNRSRWFVWALVGLGGL